MLRLRMLARIKLFGSVLKCAYRLEGATAIAVKPCVAPAPAPSHHIRHIHQIFIIRRFEHHTYVCNLHRNQTSIRETQI
jgi:hypothetical protein